MIDRIQIKRYLRRAERWFEDITSKFGLLAALVIFGILMLISIIKQMP